MSERPRRTISYEAALADLYGLDKLASRLVGCCGGNPTYHLAVNKLVTPAGVDPRGWWTAECGAGPSSGSLTPLGTLYNGARICRACVQRANEDVTDAD